MEGLELMKYPTEPLHTDNAVAVTWASGKRRWLAIRDFDDMYWHVTDNEDDFTWARLMIYVTTGEENPQAVLDTVRVIGIEPPEPPRPTEPPQTGRHVVAQFGNEIAVRESDFSDWHVTGWHSLCSWSSLMNQVKQTTGYAAWKVLN